MTVQQLTQSRLLPAICCVMLSIAAPRCLVQAPSSVAVSAFNSYVHAVESRLSTQHGSLANFMATPATTTLNQLCHHPGDFVVEQITPSTGLVLPDALLHHWRGTVYIPGTSAEAFTHLLRNYTAYSHYFAPQVLNAKVLSQHGNQFQVNMRVRQQHVITVVLDTTYNVAYGQLDPLHGYSISRSTHISEIESAGAGNEHILSPAQSHGFLWRQNTYWTYEQRDGGLYIQIESISLTRSIPYGLGWVVGPFIESIPRDSLEFTLRAVSRTLQSQERKHA